MVELSTVPGYVGIGVKFVPLTCTKISAHLGPLTHTHGKPCHIDRPVKIPRRIRLHANRRERHYLIPDDIANILNDGCIDGA